MDRSFPKTVNEKTLLQEVKEGSSRFIRYNTSIKKEKSVEDGRGKREKCYLEGETKSEHQNWDPGRMHERRSGITNM
jgi:hypothetical protein